MKKPVITEGKRETRRILVSRDFIQGKLMLRNDYCRKITQRGKQGGTWSCKKVDKEWYFYIDHIPNRSPNFYRDQLPSAKELIELHYNPFGNDKEALNKHLKSRLEKRILDNIKSEDRKHYQEKYSIDTAMQLAEAKSWMDFSIACVITKEYIRLGISSKIEFYTLCSEVLKEKKIKGLKVSNPNSFRNKVANYIELSDEDKRRDYFIHNNKGNNNRRIVRKVKWVDIETGEVTEIDIHLTAISYLYMNIGQGNKEYKIDLHKKYCELMEDNKCDAVAYSTFCGYTASWEASINMGLERHGSKAFNDKFMPFVSAEPLKMSDSLWAGDGSSSKLYYNAGGKARALMCYRVFDVRSRKVLGYTLYEGDKKGESEEVILSALKMAIDNNDGKVACEFITDNGGGAGTDEFHHKMELMFTKHHKITKGNSQENPAEPIIKLMSDMGREFKNWGGSFNASAENKNNPDYFKLKDLPTRDEAVAQVIQWIEKWNNSIKHRGVSPNELYQEKRNPKATKVEARNYRYVFGNTTSVNVAKMRGFVDITLNGIEHRFTIPNLTESIKEINIATGYKMNAQVIVKWDEIKADLYTVVEKNKVGDYILTCDRTQKASKSFAEATEDSLKNHGRLKARKEEVLKNAERYTENVLEKMSYLNKAKSSKGNVKKEQYALEEAIYNEEMTENKIAFKKSPPKERDPIMDMI